MRQALCKDPPGTFLELNVIFTVKSRKIMNFRFVVNKQWQVKDYKCKQSFLQGKYSINIH